MVVYAKANNFYCKKNLNEWDSFTEKRLEWKNFLNQKIYIFADKRKEELAYKRKKLNARPVTALH